MKLDKFIYTDQILLDVKAKNKELIIRKMVSLLSEKYNFSNEEEIIELLVEREELGSTGIGEGVALPHIRKDDLFDEIYVAIARTKKPLNFDAIDGVPCQIFILVLGPEKERQTYMDILASFSRILRHKKNREEFLEADSPGKMKEIFHKNGIH